MIKYQPAPDVESLFGRIVTWLGLTHIDCERVRCVRSVGSQSRYTVARIHGLPRIWQKALGMKACYVLEVISERYDTLSAGEKEKVLIHEALHIPHSFRGGFRHHRGNIDERKVNALHRLYKANAKTNEVGMP
ncbi:MAG: putative metallopeptidase [Candidatus Bathyarchaeia archaeon]